MVTRIIAWFRKSLARAILAAMLIPSISSILIVASLFERQSIQILTKQMEDELAEMVRAQATEIELRAQILNIQPRNDFTLDYEAPEVLSLIEIVRDIQVLEGAGYGFLVTTGGQVIAHPNLTRAEASIDFPSLVNMTNEESIAAFQPFFNHMIDGNRGIGYYNTDHDQFLLAYAPINSLNWSLGITVPRSAVIAPAIDMRVRLIMITVSSIIFAVLLSYWLVKIVHQPLRILLEGVRQVSRRGYAEPIMLQSFSDLNDLASAFNEMALKVHERETQFKSRLSRLKIEIDQQKRSKQVEQITETDFFKRLEVNVSKLRTNVRNGNLK